MKKAFVCDIVVIRINKGNNVTISIKDIDKLINVIEENNG